MNQPNEPVDGTWSGKAGEDYAPLREPKIAGPRAFVLSPNAVEFVPKGKGVGQPNPFLPYHQAPQGHFQSQQMAMQPSQVHQRIAMAQGGVEPGGDGGGGGYDYSNGGPMANGIDADKISALQNRLSSVQIGDGGEPVGMSRGDNNGKEYNHHQHHQQPMQPHHHQPHRGQQQHQGGHHGYHHHHHQQQQQQYPYGGVGYANNHMNHPGATGGGMPGDHRKHNNGGQQQHHHHRSRQQHHHHHHHHHQQQQHGGGGHHQGMGGGGHHGMMSSMAGGGNFGPNGGGAGGYNYDEQQTENETFALDYLTKVIAELFDNPGMFEDIKQKLSTMFADFVNNQDVMTHSIEMIFEQSIKESNFRYMGARLIQLLDSLQDDPQSWLRHLLLLKMSFQNNELQEFMQHEQVKVRGTTLFLAELYMQLRTPQHPFGESIAGHVISAIEILLNKEGPENVKCVCQCLKLCGFELEKDCPEKVNIILETLEQVVLKGSLQSSAVSIIRSVLDLRSNSWGRSEEVSAPVENVTVGLDYNDRPVIYGPDGQVLTEEESTFLETNVEPRSAAFNGCDEEDTDFGLCDPDEELEIQLAYEDFLQSSNSNRQQKH